MSDVTGIPQRDETRITPWELIFGPAVFDQTRFEVVRAEAGQAGARNASELFMLPAAGELLREMSPAAGGRDAVAQVLALIHAAYRFWLCGRNVYRVPDAMLRDILADPACVPAVPLPAGYVQLPRNVIWARISEDGAPEPVDGFFWSVPEDDPTGALELLYALGMRVGRPGLSLFDVRLESAAQLEQWSSAPVRGTGEDFANILPGGELQGYLALAMSGEALKLAARCFTGIGTRVWRTTHIADQRIHEPADG